MKITESQIPHFRISRTQRDILLIFLALFVLGIVTAVVEAQRMFH